jgi:hypothetical protein
MTVESIAQHGLIGWLGVIGYVQSHKCFFALCVGLCVSYNVV